MVQVKQLKITQIQYNISKLDLPPRIRLEICFQAWTSWNPHRNLRLVSEREPSWSAAAASHRVPSYLKEPHGEQCHILRDGWILSVSRSLFELFHQLKISWWWMTGIRFFENNIHMDLLMLCWIIFSHCSTRLKYSLEIIFLQSAFQSRRNSHSYDMITDI